MLVTWQRQPVDQPALNRQAEGFSAPETNVGDRDSYPPPCVIYGWYGDFFKNLSREKHQQTPPDMGRSKNFICKIWPGGGAFLRVI